MEADVGDAADFGQLSGLCTLDCRSFLERTTTRSRLQLKQERRSRRFILSLSLTAKSTDYRSGCNAGLMLAVLLHACHFADHIEPARCSAEVAACLFGL